MVEESIILQVLQWPTTQGREPQGDGNLWSRLLWTRVSRKYWLYQKGTKGLLEKIEDVSRSLFKVWSVFFGRSVGRSVGCLFGWLAGWLVSWLVSWLVD